MQRQVRAIAIVYTPHLRRATAVFAAVFAISLFMYGFFLLEAVAHTASRTQAQRQIQSLTSNLSVLEQNYLSETKKMTLERAGALGFVAPAELSTVYAAPTRGLSIRTQ